jgi:hypothetical protein
MDNEQFEVVGSMWLTVLVLQALTVLPGAWVVMLALGATHSEWPSVPAFGYGTVYIIMWGLSVLVKFLK